MFHSHNDHPENFPKGDKSGFMKNKIPPIMLSTLQQIEQQKSVMSMDGDEEQEQFDPQVESHELIVHQQEILTQSHKPKPELRRSSGGSEDLGPYEQKHRDKQSDPMSSSSTQQNTKREEEPPIKK
jgi:hypothetical protein